jgi:glucose/mannose-6-phosphate isomerase
MDEINGFPRQLSKGLNFKLKLKKRKIDKIILAGMGGSALPGELLKSYVDLNIPFEIHRDYGLPKTTKNTLLLTCSYSGNTEETVSALKEGLKRKIQIIVYSSGGVLTEIAIKNNLPLVKIPSGVQPRNAFGYFFYSFIKTLDTLQLTNKIKEVEETGKWLEKQKFKTCEKECVGKTPLIYTSSLLEGVGRACKIKFNENAKTPAFFNVFPELNHNEMNGFENLNSKFVVFYLKSVVDSEKVRKRMKITKGFLEERRVKVIELNSPGETLLQDAFYYLHYFNFLTVKLAKLYKVDPWKVELVEKLKSELKK